MADEKIDRLLRPAEAIARLGISIDTLRRMDKDGDIRIIRTRGGHRRVPESEIKRLRGE